MMGEEEVRRRRRCRGILVAGVVTVLLLSACAAPAQPANGPTTQPAAPSLADSQLAYLQQAVYYYGRYHALAPDDLLGLKKLAEVCTALEGAGVEDESCRQAAERVMEGQGEEERGRQGEEENSQSPIPNPQSAAAVLREALAARTDDRRVVAELLGANVDAISIGENVLVNGGFEDWHWQQPSGWRWSNHVTRDPFNKGIFIGGPDALIAVEGTASGRVNGLWLQYDEDRSPGRSGWVHQSKSELDLRRNTDYVLSFYYRTENLSDEKIQVWLSSGHMEHLPGTNGNWQHQVILLREYASNGWVRPLFRIFSPGRIWVDGVSIRPVQSGKTSTQPAEAITGNGG